MIHNLIRPLASLQVKVPELPNLFSLLNEHFEDSPFFAFLHEWENIIFSIIISLILCLIFTIAAKKQSKIPEGFQNGVEWVVDTLRKFIVEVLGSDGEKNVPFLGTLFIYILAMNWIVIIPFMKPPTSSLNVTAALAIIVFVYVQYLNVQNYGFFGFLYHLAGSPKNFAQWMMVPLLFPIEILTQLTRPVTLALRLFGNVLGEDILIGAAALFGVFFLPFIDLTAGLPIQLPFLLFALLTGLMQALVFTLLSTIYILLSSQSH